VAAAAAASAAAWGLAPAGDVTDTEREAADAAYEAATEVVFSRLDRVAVADLDVTVTVADGTLDVDVFVHADDENAEQVAEDAALAARAAADDVME
jgi:hypothetical protein